MHFSFEINNMTLSESGNFSKENVLFIQSSIVCQENCNRRKIAIKCKQWPCLFLQWQPGFMFVRRPGMKYWPIISILLSSNSSNPSPLILSISRCHVNMSREPTTIIHESINIIISLLWFINITSLWKSSCSKWIPPLRVVSSINHVSVLFLVAGDGCGLDAALRLTKEREERADISQVTLLASSLVDIWYTAFWLAKISSFSWNISAACDTKREIRRIKGS